MTAPLEILVYDVTPINQGHKTIYIARTFPGRVPVLFDADRYDDVHMTLHGTKVYQLRREYWPKEAKP